MTPQQPQRQEPLVIPNPPGFDANVKFIINSGQFGQFFPSYIDDGWRIVSIYPRHLHRRFAYGDIRNGGRGVNDYFIPAADRDKYQHIEVHPAVYWKPDRSNGWDAAPGPPVPVPVSGQDVARSLIQGWADYSVFTVGKIGVGMIESHIQPTDRKFMNLLEQLKDQQTTMFNEIVKLATLQHGANKEIQAPEHAFAAAYWLHGDNANQLDWFKRPTFALLKNCGACQSSMPRTAIVCGKCSVNLVNFYREFGVKPGDADPIVSLYMHFIDEWQTIPVGSVCNAVANGEKTWEEAVFEEEARRENEAKGQTSGSQSKKKGS